MDYIEVADFAGKTQQLLVKKVIKVFISEAPTRVWIQFKPGIQIVEVKNADEVLEWGRITRKLEDF